MLNFEVLKEVIHQAQRTQVDQLVLLLSFEIEKPKTSKELVQLGKRVGLRKIDRWNISSRLNESRFVRKLAEGWELTKHGRDKASSLIEGLSLVAKKTSLDLNKHLKKISDLKIKKFIEEAVQCFEYKLYRAAVVMSWVGAVSILQREIVANHLSAFNTEAVRRNNKWKMATNEDELGKLKEYDFLEILEAISVFGKNVKQELIICLQLRNSCGHPNTLEIGEAKAASHLEILILNVFEKY